MKFAWYLWKKTIQVLNTVLRTVSAGSSGGYAFVQFPFGEFILTAEVRHSAQRCMTPCGHAGCGGAGAGV